VKDAHAAHAAAEDKLLVQQRLTETYKNDINQLWERASAQSVEIFVLQAKLARDEQERDQALAGKATAEEAFGNSRAEINSTLFEFYKHRILGRGSLRFLGPKYAITLAEVWEQIVSELGESSYTEDELIAEFLDVGACAALVEGKEQLAKERAEANGIGSLKQTLIPDPALSTTFT